MNFSQTFLLATLQGITEFLPVSSSGHLVLAQHLLEIKQPPLFFDILVHLGTLIAVLLFFRSQIRYLLQDTFTAITRSDWYSLPPEIIFILVGSLPAALFGILLNPYTSLLFSLSPLLAIGFLATTLALASTYFFRGKNSKLTWQKALVIGIFQALAILPGISRSGLTLAVALWLGVKREKAFEFSFLLSIPAILGASALQLSSESGAHLISLSFGFGFVTALTVGYLSLKVLQRVMLSRKLYSFAFYTLLLALITGWISL